MNGSRDNKRGASLIYVVILVAVLGILGTAYVAVLTFGSRSASGQRELVQAQILTESYQESITNAGIQNTDPVKAAVESYNAACDAWEASYSAYLSSLGTDDPLPEPDAFSWSYGTSSADSQKIPIEPRSSPAESAAPAAQTGSTAKTAAVTSTLGVSGSASGGAGSVGPYTISVSLVTKVTYSDNSYTQTAAYTGTGGRSGSMTGTVTKAEGTYHPGDTVEGPEISVPSSALQVSLEKNNSKKYYDTDRYNWYYNGDIGFNTKYASSDIVVYVSSAVKILNLSGFYDGGGGKHAIYLVFGEARKLTFTGRSEAPTRSSTWSATEPGGFTCITVQCLMRM